MLTENPVHENPEAVAVTPVAARWQGRDLESFPTDLYIPPDALEVVLEAFAGPLDLLLYLIKRQNLDILNIPVAEITEQYTRYIELMQVLRLELAAEYLVMAAMLAEIKSRMLLPRLPVEEGQNENDPRAELIRRLLEYERFKQAAENLAKLPQVERDIFLTKIGTEQIEIVRPQPQVSLKELLFALQGVLKRAELQAEHQIAREPLSIRQRMSEVLQRLTTVRFMRFTDLFTSNEGRLGVVVTLIAVLELLKQSSIDLVQTEAYGPIHVKALE